MLFIITVVTLFILIIYLILQWNKLNHGLPPGPRGIPFLGNLVQMGRTPHLKLSQWAEEYGKFYTIHLAEKRTLVINDQKLIKELFGLMAATGKLKTEFILMVTDGSFGIGNSEGAVWLEQKQFCMRCLKNMGFGSGFRMEPLILREVDDFCRWVESEQGNKDKVYLNTKLKQVTENIVWTMVSGERISSHKSKLVSLLDEYMKYLQMATASGLIFFSWIKYLAPKRSGYQGFKSTMQKIHAYIEQSFREHDENKSEDDSAPRDMIAAYIEKNKSCQDVLSSFYGEVGWKNCLQSVVTLLIASGETTGFSINWMVFYLTVHPPIQQKLREEIDSAIGNSRGPTLSDKSNMPYCEAVILETLRMSSLIPFGIIHELLEDVSFQGYKLPKGTILLPNLYHIHHDRTTWGDPEVFRPERFLESGPVNLKEYIVAFQPGKRSCPGELLAKDIMFLFVTKLLQKYTLSIDPAVKNKGDYLVPDVGYGLMPKNIGIVTSLRV